MFGEMLIPIGSAANRHLTEPARRYRIRRVMPPQGQSAQIGPVRIGSGAPLAIIAGPCVIESEDHTLRLAEAIGKECEAVKLPLVFKASFDKANRSSISSFRGPGLRDGLAVLGKVRKQLGLPILSDIHLPEQASRAGEVLDCVQIPAFLCRQTDLIAAAARTGRCVNVKKGQFLSPEEMGNVAAHCPLSTVHCQLPEHRKHPGQLQDHDDRHEEEQDSLPMPVEEVVTSGVHGIGLIPL